MLKGAFVNLAWRIVRLAGLWGAFCLAWFSVNAFAQNVPTFATSPDAPALQAVVPQLRHIDPLGKLNTKRVTTPRTNSSIAPAYLTSSAVAAESLSQRLTSVFAAGEKSATEIIHENGQREKTFVPPANASVMSGIAAAASLADMETLKASITNSEGLQFVRGRHGTPTYIRAADLTPMSVSSASQFRKAQGLLGAISGVLGLKNPEAELELHSVSVSDAGKTRLRYRQTFHGIPVYAQELSVYVRPTGEVSALRGNFRATPRLTETTPTLTADDARKVIQALHSEPVRFFKTQLVILPDDKHDDAKLAWRVESYVGFSEGWHYFIDALSGDVLQQISAIHRGAVAASGVDLSATTRNFTAWQSGSAYYMIDVTRPIDDASTANPMAAPAANGNLVVYDCNSLDLSVSGNRCNSVVQSSSAASGWTPAAVSALWNVYQTLDYFKSTHQRNSFDGKGGTISILTNVVYPPAGLPDGAFWDSIQSKMVFGAGKNEFQNLAKGLDVTAHELTHGVISSTANFTYSGQSGALNESFADFFGVMVDRANWTQGESVTLVSPGYLRNMANPHLGVNECTTTAAFAQPSNMLEYQISANTKAGDWGGVHCNSGIPNRAAYLIADGLSAEGLGTSIGKLDTERIYYFALTNYLHESSQFVDARKALIDAAVSLFGAGSNAEAAVRAAWDQVGVSEPPQPTTTTRTRSSADPVTGSDYLIYQQSSYLYIQNGAGSFGPINTYPATPVRPAVYYDSPTKIGYVIYANDTTGSMRAINLSTGADALITSGSFHAFAISSDGKKLASINLSLDSTIYVIDLPTSSISSLPIQPRNSEGTPISAYVIPDSIAFDYRGKTVIFDFAIPQAAPNGSTYYYWAVGTIDVDSGQMNTTAGSQPPNITMGNPVFASNNNYVIAFDLLDTTTQQSGVFLYNANNNGGEATAVIDPDWNALNRGTMGHPVFDADDTSIVVQTRYTYCPLLCTDYDPYYLYRVPITKTNGKWEGNPSLAVKLSSYFGEFPQWYRAGSRTISATLGISSTNVSFGTVLIGSSANQTLTVTNTGNVDVAVADLSISGTDFKHDGFSGLVPRGQSVNVSLTFQPTGAVGARSGSLTILSDATTAPPSVMLSGNASSPPTTQSPTTTTTTTAAPTTTTTTASTTTTTLAAATLNFSAGWNLVGNSSSGPIDAVAAFGDTTKVSTVWKWIANSSKWAFYAPSLVGQALIDYAAGKGYDVLTAINGGEGFWVNAKMMFGAQLPSGAAIPSSSFQAMGSGWNMISIGEIATPKQFCDAQSGGVTTLWAWDVANSAWYFYAPSLDASNSLASYIFGKGYLDFTTNNKTLGPGVGFWVNKP